MSDAQHITLNEFKFWLEGVEEMQPENWTPDARQWARIREKINTIGNNSEITPVRPAPAHYHEAVLPVASDHQESFPVYSGSSFVPANPGAIRQAPQPVNNALFGSPGSPTIPIKTPNLDTSSGNYEPAFI